MNHLQVVSDQTAQTLVMERDEVRVFVNFGTQNYCFQLLPSEKLLLASRKDVGERDGVIELPPVSIAVLVSTTEAMQDRRVEPRHRPTP